MPKIVPILLLLALLTAGCTATQSGGASDRRYYHSPTPFGSKTGVTFTRAPR